MSDKPVYLTPEIFRAAHKLAGVDADAHVARAVETGNWSLDADTAVRVVWEWRKLIRGRRSDDPLN